MFIRSGTQQFGDLLQDAEGHQSSHALVRVLPGNNSRSVGGRKFVDAIALYRF